MSHEEELQYRLKSLPAKRFKNSEMFKIIDEFLLSPLLPEIIECNNILHWVVMNKGGNGISSISVRYEKKKKQGIFGFFAWFLSSWGTGLKINGNGQMFICEYYRHSFFSLAEQLKTAYYERLYQSFNRGFVIVDKTR